MQLFYEPNAHVDGFILNKEEAQHGIKVLRKKSGDIIHVIDGKGTFYECTIQDDNPKSCSLTVIKTWKEDVPKRRIHIAIAPTKNIDRIEWFTEKAVEIGVHEISFIYCQNSERKDIKIDRIHKKAISAMKQSVKASFPIINSQVKFTEFIKSNHIRNKFIAYVDMDNPDQLRDNDNGSEDVLVLIGPEGDFSKSELDLALEKGFKKIGLGASRLRTETAGIVACTILNNSI